MWCLETRKGRVFVLAHLPAIVGSQAGADVLLRHPSIAARHARFEQDEDGVLRVEALDDAVVGVEKKRVRRARVRAGQAMVLGQLAFTLVEIAGSPSAGAAPRPAPPAVAAAEDELARGFQLRGVRAARPSARGGAGGGAEGELRLRGKALQFHRVEQRSGLFGADLSQLTLGTRLLLGLGALLVAAALVWGIALLVRSV